MGKKILLLLFVAVVAMVILPATALAAGLVNEYGMHYAGQQVCVDCHAFFGGTTTVTTHSRMVKQGLIPSPPGAWTVFQSSPGVGQAFSIADNTWLTVGDYAGGLGTEYLYWKGTADPTVMPWNIANGLAYDTELGEWSLAPAGLQGASYSCQRCHQLGTTVPAKNGETVPNPAATIQPTATTATQWARPDNTTVADFMSDPTVSYPGMSIQCENCHGTGVAATAAEGAHTNTGVKVSTTLDVLGQSQVCGQCHASYTNVAGTLGIYGYTTNQPLRNFVDINGTPAGSYAYTKIPTEAEFMAEPTKYWMFPNGSNAKGSHYYYDEWATTAHSWRQALAKDDPDALTYQADPNTSSHFPLATAAPGCLECHTGEGYLKSKGAKIAENVTLTAADTGKMGQECVTCHKPHPWNGADGVVHDTIREPDKAGVRSATGLTTDNQSICEDCHNWQMEVLGTTPTYAPVKSITAHVISHPQRETRHGRAVMVDVPDMGQFMPGAKCEDCHMPKTNKAANRYSHGMKPMLPGKAEEWMTAAGPSYMGEDSCSKCHGGETRDELQANIDKWQGDTQALADKAEAAIVAVTSTKPDSFFLPANAGDPDYILVGRATWNFKAWEADASNGVHNPAYVQAGLVKAEQMAKSAGGHFANMFASNSVVPNGTGFVCGKVVNGDGTGAAGASLKLSSGDMTTSDALGNFAFMISPKGATSYSVMWIRSGDARTNLTSASMHVGMAKQSSKTTIAASAKTITYKKAVKLSGKVTNAAASEQVKLQYRRTTSQSWKSLTTVTLNSSSMYSKSYKPTAKGAWYFRTLYAGTATVASSKSAGIKVIVK